MGFSIFFEGFCTIKICFCSSFSVNSCPTLIIFKVGTVFISAALGIDRFVLQSTFGKIMGFFEAARDNFFFGIIGTSVEEKALFIVDATGIGLVIASEFTDIIFGPSTMPFPVNDV